MNWSFLREMEVGEYFDLAHWHARTNAYVIAKRLGIEVSVKGLPNGDFRITRIL